MYIDISYMERKLNDLPLNAIDNIVEHLSKGYDGDARAKIDVMSFTQISKDFKDSLKGKRFKPFFQKDLIKPLVTRELASIQNTIQALEGMYMLYLFPILKLDTGRGPIYRVFKVYVEVHNNYEGRPGFFVDLLNQHLDDLAHTTAVDKISDMICANLNNDNNKNNDKKAFPLTVPESGKGASIFDWDIKIIASVNKEDNVVQNIDKLPEILQTEKNNNIQSYKKLHLNADHIFKAMQNKFSLVKNKASKNIIDEEMDKANSAKDEQNWGEFFAHLFQALNEYNWFGALDPNKHATFVEIEEELSKTQGGRQVFKKPIFVEKRKVLNMYRNVYKEGRKLFIKSKGQWVGLSEFVKRKGLTPN